MQNQPEATAPALQPALDRFAKVWGDDMVASHYAEGLVYAELDSLADLLTAAGSHEAAERWRAHYDEVNGADG